MALTTFPVTREDLLTTAGLLRAQSKRLCVSAQIIGGEDFFRTLVEAEDLERRAEQMEKEAGGQP